MILKKYLTEVSFINGSEEFKSYRNYTKTIIVDRNSNELSTIRMELNEKEIDLESLSIEIQGKYDVPVYWRKINGSSSNLLEAYLTGFVFIEGDIIEVNYIGLNEAVSDLYSVDYESGVLYLAAETNVPLNIDYKFYNTMIKGKKAEQLDDEDYQISDTEATVNNYKTDTTYKLIYNVVQKTAEEYTTPILNNIKVNYINTSETESF